MDAFQPLRTLSISLSSPGSCPFSLIRLLNISGPFDKPLPYLILSSFAGHSTHNTLLTPLFLALDLSPLFLSRDLSPSLLSLSFSLPHMMTPVYLNPPSSPFSHVEQANDQDQRLKLFISSSYTNQAAASSCSSLISSFPTFFDSFEDQRVGSSSTTTTTTTLGHDQSLLYHHKVRKPSYIATNIFIKLNYLN